MPNEELVQDLLNNYIYQKQLLLEKAGSHAVLNQERLAHLVRPRIEKMANLVSDWDVKPDVLMEAVFQWARYNKHPDGPMPNMLFSSKYLVKALGHFFQVPFEVVSEKRSMAMFLERTDFQYQRTKAELEIAGITDLATAASYPVEFRYLIALNKGDRDAMFYLAVELLEQMRESRKTRLWLEHRGLTYEKVADAFNRRRKQLSE